MPRYRITVAYDGTEFVGWQLQDCGVSIQGLLEQALFPFEDRRIVVAGAGRTDAGVHASGQVAAFMLERPTDPSALVRALNARLPPAVRVLDAAEVRASFHPRFDAVAKTYKYRIVTAPVVSPFEYRYAWHLPGALDIPSMQSAAAWLVGRRDFAAFRTAGTDVESTEREVYESVIQICGSQDPRHTRQKSGGSQDPRHSGQEPGEPADPRDSGQEPGGSADPWHSGQEPGGSADPRDSGQEPGGSADPWHSGQKPGGSADARHGRQKPGGSADARHDNPDSDGVAPVFRPASIEYVVRGDGFLRHMVRAIVGTLVEVGKGRRPVEWVAEVVESRDRTRAARNAPPEGLCLVSVDYPASSLATQP